MGGASSLSFGGASLPPQQRRTRSACSSTKQTPKHARKQHKQALHQGKSRRAQPPSAGGRHLHGHVISSQGNCDGVDRTSHHAPPRRGRRKPCATCTLTCNQARTGSFLRLRITRVSFLYSSVPGPFLPCCSHSNKYLSREEPRWLPLERRVAPDVLK